MLFMSKIDGLRGMPLVSWHSVYRPHDEGGLGI